MSQHKFILHSLDDIQTWKDPEWLIKDILPLNSFSEIIGKWESGKTFVVLDWALSVATGRAWGGKYPVKQGGVLYVFGEGKPGVKQRVNAWFDHYGVSRRGVPFRAVDLPLQLAKLDDVNRFTEDVDAQMVEGDIKLIIFDTLARSLAGVNEDSAEDMSLVVNSLDYLRRGYDCTVLTVHHTGHHNSKRGRGSSVIPAAIDTSILCEKKPDSRIVKISCQKIKDADRFDDFAVTLMDSRDKTPEGKPLTLVAELGGRVPVEDPADILSRSPNQQKLLTFVVKERQLSGISYNGLRSREIVKDGSFHVTITKLEEIGLLKKLGHLYFPSDEAIQIVENKGFN